MKQRTRILIVDGDRSIKPLQLPCYSADGDDYETFVALSSDTALLEWALVQPDLVLLDITMAGGEGWETVRRLREQSTVPIIALSALADPQITIKSLQLGADYCLTLPVNDLELGARMRALLRRTRKPSLAGAWLRQPAAWAREDAA
jgi:DNA-binding response OmpR family regulator